MLGGIKQNGTLTTNYSTSSSNSNISPTKFWGGQFQLPAGTLNGLWNTPLPILPAGVFNGDYQDNGGDIMSCGCKKNINVSGYEGYQANMSPQPNNPTMNLGNNLVAFGENFGNLTTSNISPAFAINRFGGGQSLQQISVGTPTANAGPNQELNTAYQHAVKSPLDIFLIDLKQGIDGILSDIQKIKTFI
jgi:hypothetical protein